MSIRAQVLRQRALLSAAVAAIVGVGGVAQAATITNVNLNFNGSDQLTPNFTQAIAASNTIPAGGSFTYSATAGVLDNAGAAGGGVVAPATTTADGTTAYYNGGTVDLTGGATYTVSEMFLRGTGTAGNRPLQIGLSTDTAHGFNGANGLNFFSTRVDANSVVGQDALEFQVQGTSSQGTNNNKTQSLSRTNYTFIASHWYKLVGSFTETNAATGAFNLTGSVYDYGTDGVTVPAAPVLTITNNTFVEAALANNAALDVGFRNNDSTVGVQFDNFAVSVPEPTSLGLVAAGGLAVLGRRRKQK